MKRTKTFLAAVFLTVCACLFALSGVEFSASADDYTGPFFGRAGDMTNEQIADKIRIKMDYGQYMAEATITVLTHGFGDAAPTTWSNNYYPGISTGESGEYGFAYDKSSLIWQLEKKAGQADVYWAKMQEDGGFRLIPLSNPGNSNRYNEHNMSSIETFSDISKHIIIVFESANYFAGNDELYQELESMLNRVLYDYSMLNNGYLPRVNLIGHSRGGITNLQYALEYPWIVSSMFSVGAPFFGSDIAKSDFLLKLTGLDPNAATNDITDPQKHDDYYDRWNEGYEAKYKYINAHALGGYSTIELLLEAAKTFNDPKTNLMAEIINNILHIPVLSEALIFGAYYIVDEYVEAFTNDRSVVGAVIGLIRNIAYRDISSIITRKFVLKDDMSAPLNSQLGRDNLQDRDYGFKTYKKLFDEGNYNPLKLTYGSIPIVHNLEARDSDFINYILGNITLGKHNHRWNLIGTTNPHTHSCLNCEYVITDFHLDKYITDFTANYHNCTCAICGYQFTEVHDLYYISTVKSGKFFIHTYRCSPCGYEKTILSLENNIAQGIPRNED